VNDARLQVPPGYDPKSAGTARIAWLAAQLDDQLRLLATRLAGASVELLEWQLQPGVNTIGMLLAHNAVGEAYWVHIAAGRVHDRVEADRAVTATLGIGLAGDGMPIPPGGGHPASLAGAPLDRYFELLHRARAATHAALRTWDDEAMENIVSWEGRNVTLSWIAYHLLEHFAAHAGQIALLRSLHGQRPTVA
jgi:hypothetical protein